MAFKKVIKNDFMNIGRVYPIQQHKVYDFISMVRDNPDVKKLVVFGSSVTLKCHTGSDVDFYVELDKDVRVETRYMLFLYDIWTNYNVNDEMKHKIDEKGVTVYERD